MPLKFSVISCEFNFTFKSFHFPSVEVVDFKMKRSEVLNQLNGFTSIAHLHYLYVLYWCVAYQHNINLWLAASFSPRSQVTQEVSVWTSMTNGKDWKRTASFDLPLPPIPSWPFTRLSKNLTPKEGSWQEPKGTTILLNCFPFLEFSSYLSLLLKSSIFLSEFCLFIAPWMTLTLT